MLRCTLLRWLTALPLLPALTVRGDTPKVPVEATRWRKTGDKWEAAIGVYRLWFLPCNVPSPYTSGFMGIAKYETPLTEASEWWEYNRPHEMLWHQIAQDLSEDAQKKTLEQRLTELLWKTPEGVWLKGRV